MQFLADAGISPATVEFLKQLGHDAVHVRSLGMQRAPGRDVVDRARAENRIVLAFDLDFGEILALRVLPQPRGECLRPVRLVRRKRGEDARVDEKAAAARFHSRMPRSGVVPRAKAIREPRGMARR